MNRENNILEVPIEDIIPNRFQPRLAFNEEGINELAESIKQHGIIQPLVVRKLGDKYEIIAGERRYKASTQAGLSKVPVIVSDIDDNKSAEVALVENLQRRNLTAIEEAKSYKNLLERGYLTQEQLANKMGVSQSTVANKLRLLNLDEEVQDALLNEKISERHARSLLTLANKEDQKNWLKRIVGERLTVRQLDLELKKAKENNQEEIPLVQINPNLDEIISNAEDINIERKPHDVASMLKPETVFTEEENKEEEEKIEEPVKNSNKFFNFLEDEEANMDVVEIQDILSNISPDSLNLVEENKVEPKKVETPIFPTIEEPVNITPTEEKTSPIIDDELETLDVLEDFNPITEINMIPKVEEKPKEETPTFSELEDIKPLFESLTKDMQVKKEEPIIPITPEEIPKIHQEEIPVPVVEEPVIEETPMAPVFPEIISGDMSHFKSIFFPEEEKKEEPTEIKEQIEISPTPINTIEEVEPVIKEELVDPMDRIVTLEPGYEQKQEELAGTDLKTAINTVRETVKELENRGFIVECEEADLDNLYHITIKINKN